MDCFYITTIDNISSSPIKCTYVKPVKIQINVPPPKKKMLGYAAMNKKVEKVKKKMLFLTSKLFEHM